MVDLLSVLQPEHAPTVELPVSALRHTHDTVDGRAIFRHDEEAQDRHIFERPSIYNSFDELWRGKLQARDLPTLEVVVARGCTRLKNFDGGAKRGWYFAERAKKLRNHKYKVLRCPARCSFRTQTVLCEYGKLVKRLNFPSVQRRHLYSPSLQPLPR